MTSFRLDRRILFLLFAVLVAIYTLTALSNLNMRVERQKEFTGHSFVISDLFPRWLGARAMLAGVSPYSEEFRTDLHRQYYGEAHSREWERENFRTIAEFFYPPYVLIPLLPLLWVPFEAARWLGGLGIAAAIAAGTLLWARHAGVPLAPRSSGFLAVLALVFYPSLDAITLQQLTGLVYLYVIAAIVLAARGRYAAAGVLLALAMIKPQSSLIPAACLLFWSLWHPDRRSLPLAFALTMLPQLALSQWLVPTWLPDFLAANSRYREFNTIGFWLPGQLLGGALPGWLFAAGPLCALLSAGWYRARHAALASPATVHLTALTLVAGIILMPDISYYNKIFLLPSLVVTLAAAPTPGRLHRLARRLTGIVVWSPLLTFGIVGVIRPFVSSDGPFALFYSAAAVESEAHFLLLPVLVLPAAVLAAGVRLPRLNGDAWRHSGAVLLRAVSALIAAAVSWTVLSHGMHTWPQHCDEAQYIWSAAYYSESALSGDFRLVGTHIDTDPGWSPASYWALTQPMGTRALIGAAMQVTHATAPKTPFMFRNGSSGPETYASSATLAVSRVACTFAAVAGFALIAVRWGPAGLLPLSLLFIPHLRLDLTGAWAEGPLFLGLGLCAATWRTRFFPYACALAATFKLTALVLWPVAFVMHPLGRSHIARTLGLVRVATVWSVLTPPSWFFGGPAYLVLMLAHRVTEYGVQNSSVGGQFGVFAPSRYLLPLELLVALAGVAVLNRVSGSLRVWPSEKVILEPRNEPAARLL